GMLLAGKLCDALTRRAWRDSPIVVAALSAASIAILSPIGPLMPTASLMWIFVFVSGFTFNAYNGVGPMAVNQITPNQSRAQVSAVYLFVVNLLGIAAGPALVPLVNDYFFHDPASIRYSLAIVVFCAALGAACLLMRVRPIYRQKQVEAHM